VTTGLVSTRTALEHDTGPGHAERPARLVAVLERLEACGLMQETVALDAPLASIEPVQAAHDASYLETVRRACEAGGAQLDPDTPCSSGSWEATLRTTGGLLAACDRVHEGEWSNAFVASRPPGHHAEHDRAMGFCLVNHVVVAARHLQRTHGYERVAILDWDVHHGNGSQHMTESDPTLFYGSLHQHPLYPGTGAADERGRGDGEGTVVNLPLPAGTGDNAFLTTFEERLLPAVEAFAPDFLLLSAGFDAHVADPLAQLELTADVYRRLTERLTAFAAERCGGRLVSLLEGGYNLNALADCVEAHVGELTRGE